MSLILGIDPGSRRTGYALIHKEGRSFRVISSGTIRLSTNASVASRLGELQQKLEEIVDTHQPQTVAIEDIFTHRNPRSALALGQARGVCLAIAGRRNIEVAPYAPASVKQAVAGNGRADKSQIQQMVRVLLNLDRLPQEDEADAMAIAICHGMRGNGLEQLKQLQKRKT